MPSVMINLDVPDVQAAEQFYTKAFGLHVGRRIPPSVVELLGAEAPIYLLEKEQSSLWSGAAADSGKRSYERHWTPVHLDFVVEDIDAALQRALAAGAKLEREVSVSVWGKLALLADPFGHGICLVQFLNRGYDELV